MCDGRELCPLAGIVICFARAASDLLMLYSNKDTNNDGDDYYDDDC